MSATCLFCKIIKGEIPSLKLFESAKTLAFMDIGPTAAGHVLVIPKFHGAKLHDIPDEHLAELLPVAKKLAIASGLGSDGLDGPGYNILQNNGLIAHQIVAHVHIHMIPKRDTETGLQVGWPQPTDAKDSVKEIHADLLKKMGGSVPSSL